jgi:hypothetical protein
MPTDFSQFSNIGQTDFSRFMKPLDPNQNVLGVKSKPVTGMSPREAFKRTPIGQAGEIGIGAGKEIVKQLRGGQSLLERTGKFLGGGLAGLAKGEGFVESGKAAIPRQTVGERVLPELKQEGVAQQIGGIVGQLPLLAATGAPVSGLATRGLAGKALAGAGTLGTTEAIRTGEVGEEAKTAATIGAAFPIAGAVLSAPFKGIGKTLTKFADPKVKANLAGLSEQDITAITRQSNLDKKTAKQFLSAAKKAQVDRQATTPLKMVGDELRKFQKSFVGKLNSVGKKIGEEVKRLKFDRKIINTDGIKKQLQRELKQLGVRVDPKGKLDFTGSQIEGITADQTVLKFAWDKISKGKMNAGDMVNFYRNLGNRIFTGKAQQELSVAKTFANRVRRAVVDKVGEISPQIKALNKQFTRLSDLDDKLKPLIGQTGEKAPQFVRRAFSNVGELPARTLKDVDKIAKEFGLKFGKDILNKGDLALAAENAVGLTRTTGLEGILSRTVGEGKAGLVRKGIQKAEEALVGTPEENFLRLLQSPEAVEPFILKKALTALTKTETGKKLIQSLAVQIGE